MHPDDQPLRPTRRDVLAAVGMTVTGGCLDGAPLSKSVPKRIDQPEFAASYGTTAPWPQVGYDGRRSAFAPTASVPRADAGVAWLRTVAEDHPGTSAPVVDEEQLYVGNESAVVAFDPETGEEQWRTAIDVEVVHGIALVDEQVVLVTITEDHDAFHLRAFSRRSGSSTWTRRFPDIMTGAPAIVDGRMYVATRDPDATVYAIQANGSVRWASTPGGTPYTPVTVDGEALYVTTAAGRVVELDPTDGTRRWTATVPATVDDDSPPIQGTPAMDSDRLYLPGIDARLYTIDRSTGEPGWSATLLEDDFGNALPSPAVSGSAVYVNTAHGGLIALATADGRERWRTESGGLEPPAVSRDAVVGVERDAIRGYSLAGEPRWTVEMVVGDAPGDAGYIMDPAVAIAHGMVYVTLEDSRVYAIGGAEG